MAVVKRGVEDLKQMRQEWPKVSSVFVAAGLNQVNEYPSWLKNSSVVREQAEHNPCQEGFEVVGRIPGVNQVGVELVDELRGFFV